jgi:hypothetical protein
MVDQMYLYYENVLVDTLDQMEKFCWTIALGCQCEQRQSDIA